LKTVKLVEQSSEDLLREKEKPDESLKWIKEKYSMSDAKLEILIECAVNCLS